jgi:hypothetical protein
MGQAFYVDTYLWPCSFVPPLCEAKFCAVPSCVFDILECAASEKKVAERWHRAYVPRGLKPGLVSYSRFMISEGESCANREAPHDLFFPSSCYFFSVIFEYSRLHFALKLPQ